MKRPGQRLPTASRAPLSLALLVPVLLGLGCGEPEPAGLSEVLAGRRHVGPALVGLAASGDCTVSDDFIPKIRCGTEPDQDRLRQLELKLLSQLGAKPEPQKLREAAVVRLATDPDSKRVRQAVALLQEALKDESDPQQRADFLTDLSAAYLLQAETDQSAMELAFALDTALQALELDPSSEAARFNQRLALILLGVERADPSVDGPLLVEVGDSVFAPEPRTFGRDTDTECPTIQEMREQLDRWAETEADPPVAFEITDSERSCIADAKDRWIADLLAESEQDPAMFRLQWRSYRSAVSALVGFRADELREHLDTLSHLKPPEPLRIDAGYLEALIEYHAAKYAEVESTLQLQAEEAARRGYFEIAATSMRTIALVVGITGRHGESLAWNQRAFELAEQSGSTQTIAAVKSQTLELLALAGQEERAWQEVAGALRRPSSETRVRVIDLALAAAGRLAGERDLVAAALFFQGKSIQMREGLPAVAFIEALLNSGLVHLDQNRLSAAKADYQTAASKMDDADEPMLGLQHAEATLALFQGLVDDRPSIRRERLRSSLDSFREAGNVSRVIRIQLELARVDIEQGLRQTAKQILMEALEELGRQVGSAGDWRLATALRADARPVVDELLGLTVLDTEEVRSVLTRYIDPTQQTTDLPDNLTRITTFVRRSELVLLLESADATEVVRVPVSRTELSSLRQLLLSQLESGMSRERIEATLNDLSQYLISPIEPSWLQRDRLVIVADDVLAGLPYHLLPADSLSTAEDSILLDHVAISYAFDHRDPTATDSTSTILAVGASGHGSGLPALPNAGDEARAIGALYRDSLVATSATPVSLLQKIKAERNRTKALHVASHFELNTRSPLDSTLVLDSEVGSEDRGRLPIGALLDEIHGLDLLFLSGCRTGSSVPVAAHGLQSMAQAFSAAGVKATLLSLWNLDDAVGSRIAIRFHQLLAGGTPAAEALRRAQLEQRDAHPGSWGALALYH